ncbi:LuxR family transcriptional regulator [Paramagnetospirillum caucaseum]|uniref:LuxR family transcriptional regulator n=1 Tax=Paramagnetospirillum caucaseum TaxID=1244869 RepID=M2Y7M3_9PROT|nr:helix-turn-helix transcriptional regulator [Paramagnetospirillum caucaseum]EME69051.1 LuxR family transcriptional regulator [Paramagnetospirillum caucaseum]
MNDGQADIPSLTPREKQCLTHLALGLRVQELADRIGISTKTAEKQIASARKKLGAATRDQAVAIAINLKLI